MTKSVLKDVGKKITPPQIKPKQNQKYQMLTLGMKNMLLHPSGCFGFLLDVCQRQVEENLKVPDWHCPVRIMGCVSIHDGLNAAIFTA